MKKNRVRRFVASTFKALTGKSCEQLAREWQWHHFRTRSRTRAYWRLLTT